MKIRIINTEAEYNQALRRMEKIFDSEPASKEGEEAELLALLIEDYEDRVHPIDSPDPITAIKIRMEEMELKQRDLIGVIGSKGIVSEVSEQETKINRQYDQKPIRKIKDRSHVLIQEYEIER